VVKHQELLPAGPIEITAFKSTIILAGPGNKQNGWLGRAEVLLPSSTLSPPPEKNKQTNKRTHAYMWIE